MTLVVTRIYTRIEIRRNEHQEEKSVLLHATRFLKGKGPKLALPKTQQNDPSRSLTVDFRTLWAHRWPPLHLVPSR